MLRVALWTARTVAVAALVLRIAGAEGEAHGARLTVALAAGLVVLAFVAWTVAEVTGRRRVVPVALYALIAATGVLAASPSGELAPFVALVAMPSVGSDLPERQSLGCLTVGAFSCEAATMTLGGSQSQALTFAVALVGGYLIGRNRRAYRTTAQQSQRLARSAELLRQEGQHNAVLGERNRVAREIHDVLAHTLGGVDVQVRAARALLAHGEQARALLLLDSVQHLTSEGLDETRQAVQALRGDTPPLRQALEELGTAHGRRHDTRIDVCVPAIAGSDPVNEVPPEVGLAVMRVAREALTNSAKHAPGRPVTIRLEVTSGLTLSVTNEFDPAGDWTGGPRGYGLRGMGERLHLLGGTLTSGPREDGSWQVVAHVPDARVWIGA